MKIIWEIRENIMKIILLRHEERDINNPLFFSKLTDEGMIKSKLLVKELNKYNINTR